MLVPGGGVIPTAGWRDGVTGPPYLQGAADAAAGTGAAGGVQRGGDLPDEVGRPAGLQWPAVAAQQRREVAVGHEPGRDVEHPVSLPGRVDGDDVRLVDRGDRAGLAQEAGPELLVRG
jgi:hypothetical protein